MTYKFLSSGKSSLIFAPIKIALTLSLSGLMAVSVLAETEAQWGARALNIQNTLDNDASLAQTTWVGTHNSFGNNDDDALIDVNQPSSLKQQLNEGVRELVFDLHYDSSAIRMCHNNVTRYGECMNGITGNRKFYKGLDDIKAWINDGHQDQVILLKLELAKDARSNINKVEKKIDGHIYNYVYRTELTPTHGDLGKDGCTALETASLTKSKVLNAGKNIILFTSESCIGDSGFNDMTFYSGNNIVDVSSASSADSWSTNSKASLMARTKDGATKNGLLGNDSVKMKPSNVSAFRLAGLNIFETYGFGATGSAWKIAGEYPVGPEDMVWSWSAGEPSGSGSCSQLSAADNRFVDVACSGDFYASCRKFVNSDGSRANNQWWVTTQKTSLNNAETQCLQEGNGEYFFATPRNAVELQMLVNQRSQQGQSGNLWLNYQKNSASWSADIGEADDDMVSQCATGLATSICSYLTEYRNLIK